MTSSIWAGQICVDARRGTMKSSEFSERVVDCAAKDHVTCLRFLLYPHLRRCQELSKFLFFSTFLNGNSLFRSNLLRVTFLSFIMPDFELQSTGELHNTRSSSRNVLGGEQTVLKRKASPTIIPAPPGTKPVKGYGYIPLDDPGEDGGTLSSPSPTPTQAPAAPSRGHISKNLALLRGGAQPGSEPSSSLAAGSGNVPASPSRTKSGVQSERARPVRLASSSPFSDREDSVARKLIGSLPDTDGDREDDLEVRVSGQRRVAKGKDRAVSEGKEAADEDAELEDVTARVAPSGQAVHGDVALDAQETRRRELYDRTLASFEGTRAPQAVVAPRASGLHEYLSFWFFGFLPFCTCMVCAFAPALHMSCVLAHRWPCMSFAGHTTLPCMLHPAECVLSSLPHATAWFLSSVVLCPFSAAEC